VQVVKDFGEADVLVTLRTYYRKRQRPIVDAENRGMPIYVEVETAAEAEEAAAAGADVIMLDNFDPDAASDACIAIEGRAVVEVSGGVTLSNVAAYARTGATRISVGALTHSAPARDFSLEVEG